MKFLSKRKDGGKDSTVDGYFLAEIKSLATVAFLKFCGESREVYHSHSFHSLNWVLKGELQERLLDGTVKTYKPSIVPVLTKKNTIHQVSGEAWVFTLRGSWEPQWKEFSPITHTFTTLSNKRKVIEIKKLGPYSPLDYISLKEVAIFLNVSEEYTGYLVDQGKLLDWVNDGQGQCFVPLHRVLQYKTEKDIKSREAMRELVELTESYNGYYIEKC